MFDTPTKVGVQFESDMGECGMPLSGKEMRALFCNEGYEVVKGGKGSHWKLKRKGAPTVIIPNHKELKKGLERTLLKTLEEVK